MGKTGVFEIVSTCERGYVCMDVCMYVSRHIYMCVCGFFLLEYMYVFVYIVFFYMHACLRLEMCQLHGKNKNAGNFMYLRKYMYICLQYI